MKIIKDNKNIVIGVLVLIVIIGTFAWAFSTRPVVKPTVKTQQNQTMDYVGNTIVEEKDGKRLWELKARTITLDPQTQLATLKDMHGKYYEADGQVLEITAPNGIYDQKTKNIKMTGNVAITGGDGLSFYAQSVDWDNGKQLFTGTGNVQITRGDMQASADQIESNNGFTNFKLQGNAHIVKGN